LATQPRRWRQRRGLDWGRISAGEAASERWGAVAQGLCERRPRGRRVVRAPLAAACGEKNRVAASESGGGSGERQLGEAARHSPPYRHDLVSYFRLSEWLSLVSFHFTTQTQRREKALKATGPRGGGVGSSWVKCFYELH
jgi:hypothetical protein